MNTKLAVALVVEHGTDGVSPIFPDSCVNFFTELPFSAMAMDSEINEYIEREVGRITGREDFITSLRFNIADELTQDAFATIVVPGEGSRPSAKVVVGMVGGIYLEGGIPEGSGIFLSFMITDMKEQMAIKVAGFHDCEGHYTAKREEILTLFPKVNVPEKMEFNKKLDMMLYDFGGMVSYYLKPKLVAVYDPEKNYNKDKGGGQ